MSKIRPVWLISVAALVVVGAAALAFRFAPASEALGPAEGSASSVWGANYFPNVALTTHTGETVRFFDDLLDGKVVAVNFIYTTCPDACPMETARLMEVYDILGDRIGQDIHMYSITIDPETDTPEVLAQYVKDWGVGPGWTFLTGSEDDIIQIRKKLGVYIEEIQSENSQDHNLSLVIGNQSSGRWMRRSPYENPYVLANQLGSWLHNWKLASKEKRDYDDAPELRQITTGETLFRTRCKSCHTVGAGDIVELSERRIGPDLYNVTLQRDRDWLVRWMIEPDVMLEEGDPLATMLFEKYNNVPMPNLRLTTVDVEHLLEYLEEESARVDRAALEEAEGRTEVAR